MPDYVMPYIPNFIAVHIGPASQSGEIVTVPFTDYIKNVASSEIYPTWEPEALRANVLVQISFALNRVYTEFYASKGYAFQITNTTAMDQKFIPGRNIFENLDRLVDQIFCDYIRRIGYIEPLSAKFCNGTTSKCDGLSQWGSQDLALSGTKSFDILTHYYGTDIELVLRAPVQGVHTSYPGYPLSVGSSGKEVLALQSMLNRVGQNYPAIPKIKSADGVFGPETKAAVQHFQSIFNLAPDGVVGQATWYKAVGLFVGVNRLSELVSKGFSVGKLPAQDPSALTVGSSGEGVILLQYYLSILSEFDSVIPPVTIDGVFGASTRVSLEAFQRAQRLPITGKVNAQTWNALTGSYEGIDRTVLSQEVLFPSEIKGLETHLATHKTQYPGRPLSLGDRDERR